MAVQEEEDEEWDELPKPDREIECDSLAPELEEPPDPPEDQPVRDQRVLELELRLTS